MKTSHQFRGRSNTQLFFESERHLGYFPVTTLSRINTILGFPRHRRKVKILFPSRVGAPPAGTVTVNSVSLFPLQPVCWFKLIKVKNGSVVRLVWCFRAELLDQTSGNELLHYFGIVLFLFLCIQIWFVWAVKLISIYFGLKHLWHAYFSNIKSKRKHLYS